MSNLADVRPKKTSIKLGGIEEEIILDLNALALLEEKYGTVDKLFAELDKQNMLAVRDLIWAGLSHKYMDEETEKMTISPVWVGKKLIIQDLPNLVQTIAEQLGESFPQEESKEGSVEEKIDKALGK